MPEFTAEDGIEKSIKLKILIQSDKKMTYSVTKLFEILLNDRLDNFSVHISKPNTHLCPQDQQQGENYQVFEFLA